MAFFNICAGATHKNIHSLYARVTLSNIAAGDPALNYGAIQFDITVTVQTLYHPVLTRPFLNAD